MKFLGKNLFIIVTLLIALFICQSVILAEQKSKDDSEPNLRYLNRFESTEDTRPEQTVSESQPNLKPLKSVSYNQASVSPGVAVGYTWYDKQHNGTIGRMIAWGPYTIDGSGTVVSDGASPNNSFLHFSWMGLPNPIMKARKYYYNYYNASAGTFNATGQVGLQTSDEFAGYVGMDVTKDGLAVYGGHNNPTGNLATPTDIYQTEIKRQFNVGSVLFPYAHRVPDSTTVYGTTAGTQSVIWPKFAYQQGTIDVLHVIAMVSAPAAADPQSIYYFRGVTTDNLINLTWDYPPYIIDTTYTLSHDIAVDYGSDKVALIWNANLPNQGDCDTCSGTSNIHVQWDNDVYYQISNDQGLTWQPRVNITQNVNGDPGFRAYTDLSSLIDHNGDLHIIWSGVYWPANPAQVGWGENCVLFHYDESWDVIRKIHNADYIAHDCGPGAWNINISKMQLSECDGKLYALWVQFNDYNIDDDCSSRANGGDGDVSGSANGELWVSVSNDGGLTWDASRNLTNSYTPNCTAVDSITSDCESETWPSMARYGRLDQVGEDWSEGSIVDPSGSYTGDMYLDVQYIADIDPGDIVKDEGTWTISPVKWFRLPCVEPVPNPVLSLAWRSFDEPSYTKPGVQLDSSLTIENLGNTSLTYAITEIELNGSSWLSTSGFSGSIPSGLANVETGTVNLNNGGVQASEAVLVGRLVFTSNAPSSPDTVSIRLVVADTIILPEYDTLLTGCLALAVSNSGNFGAAGTPNLGLDWDYSGADCDTSFNTYLYDGSPVLLWDSGGGYVYQNNMFDQAYPDKSGFRAISSESCVDGENGYNFVKTNHFTTFDSSVTMRHIFIGAQDPSNCDFVIQILDMWSGDGQAHNDLRIGSAYDWNIPSDSGAVNTSGIDFARNLIYQVGAEYHQDDDPDSCGGVDQPDCPCQDNDRRFGGTAFIESINYTTGQQISAFPHGAYTAENDTFVDRTGNFVPSELWDNMAGSGFITTDSVEDIHTVMVYDTSFDLNATDTIRFVSIMATVLNGTSADLSQAIDDGIAFYNANNLGDGIPQCGCCVGMRGDFNGDGGAISDISDLLFFVDFMFLPPGSAPYPPCFEEADVNGDGQLDIQDIMCYIGVIFLPYNPWDPWGCIQPCPGYVPPVN